VNVIPAPIDYVLWCVRFVHSLILLCALEMVTLVSDSPGCASPLVSLVSIPKIPGLLWLLWPQQEFSS
jgi:hypothetical protein